MFGGRTEWYLTDPFGKRCVPPKKAPIRSLKIIIFRVQPLISCGTISRSPRRRWMIYAGFWTVRLRQLSNISRQTTIRCCKPLTFGRNRLYWKYKGATGKRAAPQLLQRSNRYLCRDGAVTSFCCYRSWLSGYPDLYLRQRKCYRQTGALPNMSYKK